jgi:hypothetical protein
VEKSRRQRNPNPGSDLTYVAATSPGAVNPEFKDLAQTWGWKMIV